MGLFGVLFQMHFSPKSAPLVGHLRVGGAMWVQTPAVSVPLVINFWQKAVKGPNTARGQVIALSLKAVTLTRKQEAKFSSSMQHKLHKGFICTLT